MESKIQYRIQALYSTKSGSLETATQHVAGLEGIEEAAHPTRKGVDAPLLISPASLRMRHRGGAKRLPGPVCALPGARLRGPRLGVPGFDVPNQAAEARGF